jgi:hypothetical protein
VGIEERVEARKTKIEADAAWNILKTASVVTIAKGKKILTFDPAKDNKEEILKHAMGPSGSLRAPTLRVKDGFVIGFTEDLYEKTFG